MRRKGFTLIELLAVIIILAIIALIATPIVLDVIKDAKDSAARSSAHGVLHSAKYYYTEEYMKNGGSFSEYECSFNNGEGCELLSISGDKPTTGNLSINNDGIVNGKIEFNDYVFYICNNKVLEEESSECSFIEYEKVYSINESGIITGFKTEENVSILNFIIPTVYAANLTTEAEEYIKDGKITIPEYVGNVEVTGIGCGAFTNYEITEITILSEKEIEICEGALPTTLTKLKVNGCLVDKYNLEVEIEGFGDTCEKTLYVESILNGAVPELYIGLVPVTINPTNGEVKVADLYSEWYSYSNKLWANAVTVNDETYRTAAHGTTIPEDVISAYYVWIPRYKYKLFNASNGSVSEQEIEIIFENNETEKSNGTTNGEYLTHPGFTFGTKELNGMWVGKFETTGTETSITIKPNLESVHSISLSKMFVATRNMEKLYNNYGFVSENGELNNDGTYTTTDNGIDIHIMKSMDWGTVAYLTNSKYGKCEDGICTSIGVNNYYNNGTLTGCGNVANSAQSTECNNYINALASTTGNITGIYDMSGGKYDYLMGNMKNSSGTFYKSNSGFTTIPNTKYYNSYSYGTSNADQKRGLLGDATRETMKKLNTNNGGWYNNTSYFLLNYQNLAFVTRGGKYSMNPVGLFTFSANDGSGNNSVSFRIVISAE